MSAVNVPRMNIVSQKKNFRNGEAEEKFNKTLTGKALNLILQNQWKGNIRQLFSCLDRACVLSENSVISEIEIADCLF